MAFLWYGGGVVVQVGSTTREHFALFFTAFLCALSGRHGFTTRLETTSGAKEARCCRLHMYTKGLGMPESGFILVRRRGGRTGRFYDP